MFENFLKTNGFTKSRNRRIFMANLRRFTQHLLEDSNHEELEKGDFNQPAFTAYLGVFLNICLMRKLFTAEEDKAKVNEFNDLLYAYSHKKFYDFVSKIEVRELVKVIIAKQGLENFVDNHSTLSTKRDFYVKHIQRLVANMDMI